MKCKPLIQPKSAHVYFTHVETASQAQSERIHIHPEALEWAQALEEDQQAGIAASWLHSCKTLGKLLSLSESQTLPLCNRNDNVYPTRCV